MKRFATFHCGCYSSLGTFNPLPFLSPFLPDTLYSAARNTITSLYQPEEQVSKNERKGDSDGEYDGKERRKEELMIRKKGREGGGYGAAFQPGEGGARVMTVSWSAQLGFRRGELGITVMDGGRDTLRCWLM